MYIMHNYFPPPSLSPSLSISPSFSPPSLSLPPSATEEVDTDEQPYDPESTRAQVLWMKSLRRIQTQVYILYLECTSNILFEVHHLCSL